MYTLVPVPEVPVLYRYLRYRYGIMTKSQRGWKGPIGPGEIREDLVGWLCHRLTCGIAMPTISLT